MEDEELSHLQDLLDELTGTMPRKNDPEFNIGGQFDGFTYSAAVQEWTKGYNEAKKAYDAAKNFEAGLFQMPDGTLVPLDELDDTEIELVNKYNSQLYRNALSKFGLDEFAQARADIGAENDRRSTQFQDKLDEVRMSLGYDEAELARSAQELDRWLAGQDVAQEDAANIAAAKQQAMSYGTTNGKSSFTGNDLGGAVAALARQGGLSGDVPLLSYPGTQTLDPVGDRLASLAAMGISNAPPQVPQLGTQRGSLPTAPDLLQLPSGSGGMPPAAPPMLQFPYDDPSQSNIPGPVSTASALDTITTSANLPPWKAPAGWLGRAVAGARGG